MKVKRQLILLAFVASTTMAMAMANESHVISVHSVNGHVATGANRFLDEPLWFMNGGLGSASFAFVFGYNAQGNKPIDLTAYTPLDTVLATGVDANFIAALGMQESDIESKYINKPYQHVQVTVNPFTAEKQSVPMELNAQPGTVSRSGPLHEITLADWMKARGKMKIKCLADGTAKIKIKLSGLIANGVYTAWALFSQDVTGDALDDMLVPLPLGGVPNVIIPDEAGRVVFKRKLGYCPHQQVKFQFIDITYHADGNVYGGSVDFILPGQPAFAVTNTHVAFAVNAMAIK